MKKLLAVVLVLCLMVPCDSFAEAVVKKSVSVAFPDVIREGLYTGEVNESGVPHGFGVFEAVNGTGARYIIVGEWVNGSQTGESWRAIENGLQYIGMFENGEFVKGKYVTSAQLAEYDRALDTGFGYTPDSLLDMDWTSLDDASIVRLLSNVFGGDPVSTDPISGYVWVPTGAKFCDLPIVAVWANVDEKSKINTISYMMVNSKYSRGGTMVDEMNKDFAIIDLLISRLNARIGKTGKMLLDNEQEAGAKFTDGIKAKIQLNNIINGSVVFSYSWDYEKGLIYNATKQDGAVLFSMQKGQ